ncbi:dihydroxyacetone kinase [Lachnospiraceae bacterium PF1-21]|uniref:Dihydroxyacetone kinase subunit DhaK n=1 Tax=Ohessyouella blattaphilus TaxID=2949333 RepID=A0ABT1EH40_9FIRM|nr:dihydroxyacetone kinase subunit DhaK [Ohessyouella blattaphilus]MCP1109993.1 dihydroxyacetone kinase subunit DhaK [Ohessyouella blattaphilus]MCR8563387.1 dihydroxyacetone kinase subunit DhaK [Ohessyouella blattaphilus]MDL2250898.1 dihydroxyacetone kinase subunit DhaK [Lachnospiraceae bacterium OttesenSCG-928-J05]
MKKIINKPETVVFEMCKGMAAAHPGIKLDEKHKILSKKDINPKKVSLISGGGSGHEPAHAGFIGTGMLDAAVCGDVFASPSQIQVYQAIKENASESGTLLIIKNYSGDMMNFKNAAVLAAEDGITVDYVKVDDDIAVEDSLYTVGHRGVAGTILVHKIAGAAAEQGLSLAEVKALANKTIANVKSIGFAFSSCTVPAKGAPTFEIGEQEMEYGVGIHGEPGISRDAAATADELAEKMVGSLLKELHIKPGQDTETALLVNGFGGTPLQELYLLNNAVLKVLHKAGVRATRIYVGNYMTSIDMQGASLSILKLDEELKKYLSMYSDAPAFKIQGTEEDCVYQPAEDSGEAAEISYEVQTDAGYAKIEGNKITLNNIIYLVDKMSEVIIRNEVPFCELDSFAGDGDFGMSVAKGFRKLKEEWKEIVREDVFTIGIFLQECAMIIMEHCGGASGPIWGSAFRSAGKSVGAQTEIDAAQFAEMMQAAVKGIQDTGKRSFGRGAVVGDKTLIDALVPCADTWSEEAAKGSAIIDIFAKAAKAAADGAKKTEAIVARMGRAGTVGERSIGHPDAGAHALGVIFMELSESLERV